MTTVMERAGSNSLADNHIGQRVREMREARGWSQRVLAYRSGVSNVSINKIESGETIAPNIDVLRKLAAAFGTPVEVLVGAPPPEGYEGAREDADRILVLLARIADDDPVGLVDEWTRLPADLQAHLSAIIRALAATYSDKGGANDKQNAGAQNGIIR